MAGWDGDALAGSMEEALERQQEALEARRARKDTSSNEERERKGEQESLRLSRARIEEQLGHATNPAHRIMLERALKALERAKAAAGPSTRPDRFARVATTTSSIIAVASVTFERLRSSDRPAWLEAIMAALHRSPGLLGAHTATSLDQPGMFLIFTWWENKQALNDFYYSDIHQGWIGGRVSGAMTTDREFAPSQVAIELFTALPGGMTLGGGFVPDGAQPR